MSCETCRHAEMCRWVDEVGARGCDFEEQAQADGDAISRRDAIDAMYKMHMNGKKGVESDLENLYGSAKYFSETISDAVEVLEDMPSVAIPPAEPYKGMTNGEVIKVVFPEVFVADIREKSIILVIGTNDSDWWNNPYEPQERSNKE